MTAQQWNDATNLRKNHRSSFRVNGTVWKSGGREGKQIPQACLGLWNCIGKYIYMTIDPIPSMLIIKSKAPIR